MDFILGVLYIGAREVAFADRQLMRFPQDASRVCQFIWGGYFKIPGTWQ